jgi:hypothetical protein
MREIIEFASTDEAAPPIDLNTLVHMLLSKRLSGVRRV